MKSLEQTNVKRCAIYTRKSTQEGLDKEFNTLEAQREAGLSYIASQRHEGWVASDTLYDDGGFTGANLERPALERLMQDIRSGRIDIVVCYKIDRLTRSLTDFAKLVDVFDAHGTSFVSVTQHFNTKDSMGRLTLNILLSFAQFEREVIAERVRDKFAASRKKGIWMGGRPPLGYDVADRRLIINDAEAAIVLRIFQRYSEMRSMTKLAQELNDDGLTTKAWTSNTGLEHKGSKFTKAAVSLILHNPVYIGKAKYKDQLFDGEHAPIISDTLWQNICELLVTNPQSRGRQSQAKTKNFLKGLIFSPTGNAMSPSATRDPKNPNRKHRYYVCQQAMKVGWKTSPLPSVSAGHVEGAVLREIRGLFVCSTLAKFLQAYAKREIDGFTLQEAKGTLSILDEIWDAMFPMEQQRIIQLIVDRIDLAVGSMTIRLNAAGLHELFASVSDGDGGVIPDPNNTGSKWQLDGDGEIITVTVPFEVKRNKGKRKSISVPGEEAVDLDTILHAERPVDEDMVRLLAQACRYKKMIERGLSVRDIADKENFSKTQISRVLGVNALSPTLRHAILTGTQPKWLTTGHLIHGVPPIWTHQTEEAWKTSRL